MKDEFLSYEDFCSKYSMCRGCPLYDESNCRNVYDETIENGGTATIIFKAPKWEES